VKHEYGLAFLRVRGIERVRLHAELTRLEQLSLACASTSRSARGLKPQPLPQTQDSQRAKGENRQAAEPATDLLISLYLTINQLRRCFAPPLRAVALGHARSVPAHFGNPSY